MRRDVLDRLSEITAEEREILQKETLNMSLYNHAGGSMVETSSILPKGELFGIRTHTRFVDFPRHSHNYVEMIYQVQGQTHHIINGVMELTLQAGQILFLGRGTEHAIQAAQAEDIAVNFILIPAFFDSAAISLGGSNALSVFLKGNLKTSQAMSGHLVFQVSGAQMVENLLENLVIGQLEGVPLTLQQMTLELLLQHLSAMSEHIVVCSRADEEQSVVLHILSRIEREVRVNLSEIAREMKMDVTVLSRLVQKYTGSSFTELLHTARFNRAIYMLRETELSVVDISTAIGYENTAFFYRRFAKRYGCTPLEYRKKYQAKNQNRI